MMRAFLTFLSRRDMASVPKNTSSANVSLPIHDPANAPLFDYINQSARTIQRTELTVGLLSWLIMGLITIFAFVLIDHWVFQINSFLRYGVWLMLVGGSAIWLVKRVLPYMGRAINPEYAAKKIEDTIPEMKDGLISWLQLASRDSTHRGVLNTVGRYVAKHLQGQDVANVIDQFTSMKLAAMLFGLMLISAIYLAVSPKNGMATIGRLMMPWANIAPSTRVQIIRVSPGDATVTEGLPLHIATQIRGWNRNDSVQIRYSTEDLQTVDKIVRMSADIEGLTYFADLGRDFGGIVQPMRYFVEAGDAKAGPFTIKIQAVPLVLLDQIDYEYPAYMRLASRTSEGDGRIEAPEGTRIIFRAKSNQSMKKARIEFGTATDKSESFRVNTAKDVSIESKSLSVELLLELDHLKSNPTLFCYRMLAENELGESNAEPVIYPIKVIPDMAPEVQLANDLKDTIELPINQTLKLEVRASDPDFGLVSLAISGTSANQTILQKEFFYNVAGLNGQQTEVYSLDPQVLQLRVGTQMEMVATATDNRCAMGSNEPQPNIRLSRSIRVTISPPSINPTDSKAKKDESEKPSGASEAEKKQPDPKVKSENRKSPSKEESADESKGSPDKLDPKQKQERAQEGENSQQEKPGQNDPSNAGQASEGQAGAGKSAGSEKQGGQPTGSENQGGQPSNGTSNGDNPSASQGPDSGKSDAGGQTKPSGTPSMAQGQSDEPLHDGEAFEELQEFLQEKGITNHSDGSGKSIDEPSKEKNASQPSQSNEPSTGESKASNTSDPSKSPTKGANNGDSKSGREGTPSQKNEIQKPQNAAGAPETQTADPINNPRKDSKGNVPDETSSPQSKSMNSNENRPGTDANSKESKTEESKTDASPKNNHDTSSNTGDKDPNASKAGQEGSTESNKVDSKDENTLNDQSDQQGSSKKPSSSHGQKSSQGKEGKEGKEGKDSPPNGQKGTGSIPANDPSKGENNSDMSSQATNRSNGNQSAKGRTAEEAPSTLQGDVVPPVPSESSLAETEYARQATDMVLKALDRQREQPDPELLKRMGWNKQQMQAFLDRWKISREQAASDPRKKREYDESLRSLGLVPSVTSTQSMRATDDRLRGMHEEGTRVRPPESLRERFENFRKSTQP